MPKLPRELSGRALAKLLEAHGYAITRQTGSHIRLTSTCHGAEHHITIPDHAPLKIGTLSAIIRDVAAHLEIEKDSLARELFK